MKRNGGNSLKSGFTIIEVSLVLAIAGLIFLMVFLAVPAVQRSARDARRQEDITNFLAQVKKYQGANRGALPTGDSETVIYNNSMDKNGTNWRAFYANFLGDNFEDPQGENYNLKIVNCTVGVGSDCNASLEDRPTIVVVRQATCDGNHAVRSSNPRKIAVLYKLEINDYCANS